MASKFRESPHSRRRGLQTPPHVHLGESGQSGLERETGAVCLVIGISGDGIGRPATRAKALNLYTGTFPRTKVRGWHSLGRVVDPDTAKCLPPAQFAAQKNVETSGHGFSRVPMSL